MNATYQSELSLRPIAGALGAEIRSVDLTVASDALIEEIRAAFLKYHVLVFRDQTLSPTAQKNFAKCFGSLETHPYIQGLDEDPEVVAVIKEPHETVNFGGGWHMFNIQRCLKKMNM